MATRQLTGFSGSDLYINLNSEDNIIQLYDAIMNDTVSSVNGRDVKKKHIFSNFFFLEKRQTCEQLIFSRQTYQIS